MRRSTEATLFVGDLPPGFGAEDVEALFGGFAAVAGAHVIGAHCYAFVEFESAEEAAGVLEQVRATSGVPRGRCLGWFGRDHRAQGETSRPGLPSNLSTVGPAVGLG